MFPRVFMAAFPIGYKTPYKDQNLLRQRAIKHNDKRFMNHHVNMLRSSSIPGQVSNIYTKCIAHGRGALHRAATEEILAAGGSLDCHLSIIQRCHSNSKRRNLFKVLFSAESGSIEKQLRSLDSYFGKLHEQTKLHTFDSLNKVAPVHNRDSETRPKNGLESLDEYLSKLNNVTAKLSSAEVNQEFLLPSSYDENLGEETLVQKPKFRKPNTYVDIRRIKGIGDSRSTMDPLQNDETSSLYLIGILVSVNIAVFLFEIASPIRKPDFELFSLPLLYGAKINHLIMVGEWWRLVTPMFLHAGIFHMTLSCWAIVTFGPQVCKGYGSFTFFLIYILGGISGNMISFLHTADPTVGGTGPVFAIIGAWLMYQIQNRDVIANDASDNMFRKAIIVTTLGFILCNLGPIDEWTHLGAALTGMAFGFLTSPSVELNDASSGGSGGQEEGLKLVRKHGDSCKSLIVFTIFIIALSSLLFFMEPPLNALAAEDLECM
ncbi:RHOMBOID-like protein 9, chloroplastic isoform X1 [Arachis duranensis]|uniref:RHOMBOID-like protein 9, chloroplastic isoform X1 n=2 Tax=Arachis duranensis TaxID=130453 RepID=A0A9C6TC92_ARADU|nr:RHOMBOID-like protein 9, chloroplastic isoform X1 [Arachis duranensis]